MAVPRETPYARLGAHLAARAAAGEDRATLGFAALKAITGRALPPTARAPQGHRAWWGGAGHHIHAWEGWLSVGWRVAAVDLAAETVTFARPGGAG